MTIESVTFHVPGMTCGHCRSAVETEVRKVIGVESVDVDLDSKHVRIVGAGLDRAVLVAAIDEAGYDVAEV
jgi:copper chaperone